MKLNTQGRYAVMSCVDLAQCGQDPVALRDIAERQDISLAYLEQLFAKLRRAGIVESTRGPGGGYRLRQSPENTIIADIITAVDEPITITRCQGEHGCMKENAKCLTHDLWEALGANIYTFLSTVSLLDVCDKRLIQGPNQKQVRVI
jgi:Rrf2 family iron-sulfur cluster assembly transcriptional regulator